MGKLQKNGLVPYKCICGQVITDLLDRLYGWMKIIFWMIR